MWGVTGTGKTEFARSIDTHWYINADWDVSRMNEDAKYGVIDDITSKHFKYWKPFLGGEQQFTVTDKFHHKKQLFWGKPVICLSNHPPSQWKGVDYSWLTGNGDVNRLIAFMGEVDKPLY